MHRKAWQLGYVIKSVEHTGPEKFLRKATCV